MQCTINLERSCALIKPLINNLLRSGVRLQLELTEYMQMLYNLQSTCKCYITYRVHIDVI